MSTLLCLCVSVFVFFLSLWYYSDLSIQVQHCMPCYRCRIPKDFVPFLAVAGWVHARVCFCFRFSFRREIKHGSVGTRVFFYCRLADGWRSVYPRFVDPVRLMFPRNVLCV